MISVDKRCATTSTWKPRARLVHSLFYQLITYSLIQFIITLCLRWFHWYYQMCVCNENKIQFNKIQYFDK